MGYRFALAHPGAGVQHLVALGEPRALCRAVLPEDASVTDAPHAALLCRTCQHVGAVPPVIPRKPGRRFLVSRRLLPGAAPEINQHVVEDASGPPPWPVVCGLMLRGEVREAADPAHTLCRGCEDRLRNARRDAER